MGVSIKVSGINPEKTFDRIFDKATKIAINSAAKRLMTPFVPMRESVLANSTEITEDYIEYTQPQSRYLYYGKLMLAKNGSSYAHEGERKYLTSKNLNYSTEKNHLATAYWDKAMMKSKGGQLAREGQKIIDRK